MTAEQRAARREQLRTAYLTVFHGFSASRSEVAEACGVEPKAASALLGKLRSAGLVDAIDVNEESQGQGRRGAFREVEWQCLSTYDSIDEEQALAIFDDAFPPVADHRTELLYDAGLRTYRVACSRCGTLRGIATTRKDAEAKAAAHRRETSVPVEKARSAAAEPVYATGPQDPRYQAATTPEERRALIPLEGRTDDLTARETVLLVWPADPANGAAAWRVRQDEFGYWLDKRPRESWAWGVSRKLTKPEATGLVAQVQAKLAGASGGAVAADKAAMSTEGTMSQTEAPAREATPDPKPTPARRTATRRQGGSSGAAAPRAAEKTQVDVAAIEKALTDGVRAAVQGVKVEKSKGGGKRYYRIKHDGRVYTLGKAIIGSRSVSVAVGTAAPTKLTEPGKVQPHVNAIAKEADAVRN